MTIREFIEQLHRFPLDYEICLDDVAGGGLVSPALRPLRDLRGDGPPIVQIVVPAEVGDFSERDAYQLGVDELLMRAQGDAFDEDER